MSVLINADVGEEQGSDEELIRLIDMANIACGAHAGNTEVMLHTLSLAKSARVTVGAHVSYPDRDGFGRHSIVMSSDSLSQCINDQITALEKSAETIKIPIRYVKPHGALYNDMMRDPDIFLVVLNAIAAHKSSLAFMLQSTPNWEEHRTLCEKRDVIPIFEVFADRGYEDSGLLIPRSEPGACLDTSLALNQAQAIIADRHIRSASGHRLNIPIDVLCVHGDNPEAVTLAKDIRALIDRL